MARVPRVSPAMCAIAVALLLAGGCQAPAGNPTASQARPAPGLGHPAADSAVIRLGPASVKSGFVRIDVAAIAASWGRRSLKAIAVGEGGPVDLSIPTTLRLKVRGPGMNEVTSATIALDPVNRPEDFELTLFVPAGKNRVFDLQGLNEDGQCVNRLRAAADVTADAAIDLEMNALTDVVGRVLDDLLTVTPLSAAQIAELPLDPEDRQAALAGSISQVWPDDSAIVSRLGTLDLVPALTERINAITVYDAETNTIDGFLAPAMYRSRVLANLLRVKGEAFLTAATSASELIYPGTSSINIAVKHPGGSPVVGAEIRVFNPLGGAAVDGGNAGDYIWPDLPPGDWTVGVTRKGRTTYATVTTVDVQTAPDLEVVLPAPPLADENRIYFADNFADGVLYETSFDGITTVGATAGGNTALFFASTTAGFMRFAEVDADFDVREWSTLHFKAKLAAGVAIPLTVQLFDDKGLVGQELTVPAASLNTTEFTEFTFTLPDLLSSADLQADVLGFEFHTGSSANFVFDDIGFQNP